MIRPGLVLGLVLVGGSMVGCGGDDGPKAMPGTMNSSTARSSVQQAVMVRTAADSMNGGALAGAVMSLNSSAGAIVRSPEGSTTGALLNSDVEQTAQAQTAGVTCDASGCKYTNFMAGETTLNGNVTVSPGSGDLKNVKWDLTMKQTALNTGDFGLDYTGKGDIQVSLTSLSGEVTTKSTFGSKESGQSFSGSTESVVRYTAVTIANLQPTGGSVYAKTTTFVSGGGQSAAQAWDGTLEFGK